METITFTKRNFSEELVRENLRSLFCDQKYDDAIIGVRSDKRIVYSFNKMLNILSLELFENSRHFSNETKEYETLDEILDEAYQKCHIYIASMKVANQKSNLSPFFPIETNLPPNFNDFPYDTLVIYEDEEDIITN